MIHDTEIHVSRFSYRIPLQYTVQNGDELKKMSSVLDRILLMITGLLAAWSYTIPFGVLLVAGLLMFIMGFEVLDSPWMVIVSTIILYASPWGWSPNTYPPGRSLLILMKLLLLTREMGKNV